jgi:hypothetical protein
MSWLPSSQTLILHILDILVTTGRTSKLIIEVNLRRRLQ